MSLNGKVAIVTGAARGLGREYAIALAGEGASVVVADTRDCAESAALVEKAGGKALALELDVADAASAKSMAEATVEAFGRIDILINNAGVAKGDRLVSFPKEDRPAKPKLDDATWQTVLDTNLNSAMYAARAVAPQMLERRSGKIINVASTNSILAYPDGSAYQVSKAGVKMLTKVLAGEWARFNVTVNAIGPGWFVTEMTEEGFNNAEWHEQTVSEIPMKRLTDARDLGLLAVYLSSSASDWMTGQIIYLDGGETAMFS